MTASRLVDLGIMTAALTRRLFQHPGGINAALRDVPTSPTLGWGDLRAGMRRLDADPLLAVLQTLPQRSSGGQDRWGIAAEAARVGAELLTTAATRRVGHADLTLGTILTGVAGIFGAQDLKGDATRTQIGREAVARPLPIAGLAKAAPEPAAGAVQAVAGPARRPSSRPCRLASSPCCGSTRSHGPAPVAGPGSPWDRSPERSSRHAAHPAAGWRAGGRSGGAWRAAAHLSRRGRGPGEGKDGCGQSESVAHVRSLHGAGRITPTGTGRDSQRRAAAHLESSSWRRSVSDNTGRMLCSCGGQSNTMARIARSDRTSLVRSNYEIGTRRESHQPPVRQQESLEPAARTLLALTEQAIARIHQGLEVEAALHELAAALRELQALRTRDPGVRMAAQDVYEAAAALVIDKRAGAGLKENGRPEPPSSPREENAQPSESGGGSLRSSLAISELAAKGAGLRR